MNPPSPPNLQNPPNPSHPPNLPSQPSPLHPPNPRFKDSLLYIGNSLHKKWSFPVSGLFFIQLYV